MKETFVGGAFAGTALPGAHTRSRQSKAGDIPTTILGKTGEKVTIIAQGGARMDLHPTVPEAAEHVSRVYDLGVTYFDCAATYWGGKSEEAYGIGLKGSVRKSSLPARPASARKRAGSGTGQLVQEAEDGSPRYVADARCATQEEIEKILGPGGAMEAFEAAKKAGKCRFIGFTGHSIMTSTRSC